MGLDLRRVLQLTRRWWWLLLLLPLLAGIGAHQIGSAQPDRYAATVRLLVSSEPSGENVDYGTIQGNQGLAATYQQLIDSWPVLEPVIGDLGLPITLEELRDRISSYVVTGTSLIDITATDGDPAQAAAIANAVADRFRSYVLSQNVGDPVRISVAVPARPPVDPFAPRIALYVLLGIVLGLLAAITIVGLLTYLDTTVSPAMDFGLLTGAPLLSVIGYDRRLNRGRSQLYFSQATHPRASEAIRILRAKILPLRTASSPLRLAVGSPNEGDGKTTVAANLAVAIAQTGTPTVLIDANLRQPKLHAIFGIHNEFGLTSLLGDPERPWQWAATAVLPRLTLIPSGPLPDNAADLLNPERLRTLLDAIGDAAGVVLLDTPAVSDLGDALVVAQMADGVLLVFRADRTRRGALRRAAAAFHQTGARIVGVVLNGQSGRVEGEPFPGQNGYREPVPTGLLHGRTPPPTSPRRRVARAAWRAPARPIAGRTSDTAE